MKVLVIGASTGYGLSSRISAAFGSKADTFGVFYERPSDNGKPASPGWYNSIAFENAALEAGLYAKSINGDAYSNEIKQQTLAALNKSNREPSCAQSGTSGQASIRLYPTCVHQTMAAR